MKPIKPETVMKRHAGDCVRIIWNPRRRLWYVYPLENDHPICATKAIELFAVGVFGDLKPPYTPEGSPSFIGTIVSVSIVDPDHSQVITSHPYCPAKLFVGHGDDCGQEFTSARRLYVEREKMFFHP